MCNLKNNELPPSAGTRASQNVFALDYEPRFFNSDFIRVVGEHMPEAKKQKFNITPLVYTF